MDKQKNQINKQKKTTLKNSSVKRKLKRKVKASKSTGVKKNF